MRAYCLTYNTHTIIQLSYYPRPPKQQQQKETTATEKQNKKQQRGTKSKAKNKTHRKENGIFSENKGEKSH